MPPKPPTTHTAQQHGTSKITTASLQQDVAAKARKVRELQEKRDEKAKDTSQTPSKSVEDHHTKLYPKVCNVGPFLTWLKSKKPIEDLNHLTSSSDNKTDPVAGFRDSWEVIRKNCELKAWRPLKPHSSLEQNYGFIWLQFSA